MKFFHRFLDLLFPPKCPFCGKILHEPGVCPDCERALPWIPPAEVLWEEKSLRCASPLWYEGAVREALLRCKFHGAAGAAKALGQLVARCAAEEYGGGFDTVTWVPLSRKRLRKRGYDQSRLLAEYACAVWGVKPKQLLKKIADTPAQSTIRDAAARRANVLGTYAVTAPEQVAGRKILLVDDICTTGATLSECARELRLAGAESVVCVTVSRTKAGKNRENNSCNPHSRSV